jgi:3-dehydroquinate synthase
MNDMLIRSMQGDYRVHFDESIYEWLNRNLHLQSDVFYLVDAQVLELYGEKLELIASNPVYAIEASERSKTLEGVTGFIDWLLENRATKSSTIVAIGGGVVQDIATFTSHIYYRGIAWQFVPTTLLSQSDSCIGAKCGINVLPHKNQIGVLHSPKAVYVVAEFLRSQSDAALRSGFGEILKLSLTGQYQFFSEFQDHLTGCGISPTNVLPMIQASLRSKQAIIEVDENESDLRRVLNYGHSFGHALEAATDNEVSHGIGVLFGVDLINYLGTKWGITPYDLYSDVNALIRTYFGSENLPKRLSATQLIDEVRRDKKNSNGMMNFVVLRGVGDLVIQQVQLDESLTEAVQEYLNAHAVFLTA